MLRDRAVALLKVHPDEIRMVTLMAALFLCLQAGQGIGENAAFGLFLGRVDVNRLPYMYMGLGGFVSLASLAYATSLGRFRDASVVNNVLALAVVIFAVQWAAIVFLNSSYYSVLWLTTYGMSVILGTILWTIAGEVCDARQAKRLFPLFTSVGILGSVAGNLLTGVLASSAGTNHLIFVYAALLGGGFFLTREITKHYFRAESKNAKYDLISDMRAGFDFVRSSSLFRLVAFSSILYSILFFTVDFPFSETVTSYFQGDEASLASFKGLFTSVITVATFLVSLLLANRLYTRLGIIGSILIMPITYLIAFVVFFVAFSFAGAVVVRFAQMVLLGGLMGTAWNALFNVVPPERRGQVLAFNNGVPAQLGVFLSGVLIVLSKQALETKDILLLGAFVSVVSVYLTLKMKPAYGEALLNALRAGRVEVFSDQDEAFAGYQNDPAAIQVLRSTLRDPRAYLRRLAVEMSAKTGNREIIPDLVDRLYDDDGGVRTAAVRAVADLRGRSALNDVILGLDDPETSVRAETLASLPKLAVDAAPELIRTLERLLHEKDTSIQAHAAVVLIYLGQGEQAHKVLLKLLHHTDASQRLLMFQSFGHIAAGTHESIELDPNLILHALKDESTLVRREVARVARYVSNDALIQALVGVLGDVDLVTLRTASDSLRSLWPESRNQLVGLLHHEDGALVEAALDSIPAADEEILDSLRSYVQREVSNIRFLRSLVDALPRDGRVAALLVDTLTLRESRSEERLIKAVGLFGNPRALDLVRKSLNAGDISTRASALEALETLGDRTITQQILPILDRGGVFHQIEDQVLDRHDAIGILLVHDDPWLRALAARAAPEFGLTDCVDVLKRLKRDKSLIVKQAASDALLQMDGVKVKTLKTLSTLERILLLREIPMFAGLAVEDLEQIADIAHEQLYSTRGIICREGEPGNALFIIVNGEVDVVKSLGNEEMVLAKRGAGEFVGEMAVLESAPRSATLRAISDVRVLTIEGDAFTSILLDRPEVAVSVLRNMSSRLRALNAMVGSK